MNLWLTFGISLLGIIGTIISYQLNPKNQAKKKLVIVLKDIQSWEIRRDNALSKNDNNALTVAVTTLNGLQKSKSDLLQQL